MGIQSFRFISDICHICFRDMGHFSKYLKGYDIPGPQGPGFLNRVPSSRFWYRLLFFSELAREIFMPVKNARYKTNQDTSKFRIKRLFKAKSRQ